ncbi:MAG: hypothetical protein HS109_20290 [Burkholderiales bacterium]|nr:hypothetical protein [Burkholderiales bacterium]
MSRRSDRAAARRAARIRRAELRLFAAARRFSVALDGCAVEPVEHGGEVMRALAELDAAALRFADVSPARKRRRRRRVRARGQS